DAKSDIVRHQICQCRYRQGGRRRFFSARAADKTAERGEQAGDGNRSASRIGRPPSHEREPPSPVANNSRKEFTAPAVGSVTGFSPSATPWTQSDAGSA